MLREATYPPAAANVLDVSSKSMAAFRVFLYGRFWVFTEGVSKIIDPAKLRWISWSHFEADECGSLNECLAGYCSARTARLCDRGRSSQRE